MSRHTVYYLSLLLFTWFPSTAQDTTTAESTYHAGLETRVDSLKADLSFVTDDSLRFETLLLLSEELSTVRADECVEYTLAALELAYQLEYDLIIPYLINLEAMSYDDLGRYDEAIDAYQRAIEATYNTMRYYEEDEKQEFYWDLVIFYNNLGYSFFNQGAYERAMEFYLRALDIGEDHASPDVSLVFGSIAELYFALDDLQRARHFINQATDAAADSSALLFDASLLGQIYLAEAKLDSAELFFTRLLTEKDTITNYDRVIAYKGLSETHLNAGRIKESLEEAERCYAAALTLDNKIYQAAALALMAQCQFEMDLPEAAAGNLRSAIRISEESNSWPDLDVYYSLLSSYYRRKGDYRNAYEYEMKARDIRETVRSRERSDYFTKIAVDRQLEEHEKEALALKTQLERDQKLIRNSVSFGIAMFFFFLLVVFVMYLLMRFRTGKDIRDSLRPIEQLPSDKRRFLKGVTFAAAVMILPLILHSIVWNNQQSLVVLLVSFVFLGIIWLLAHGRRTRWATVVIMAFAYPLIATAPLHTGGLYIVSLAIPATFIVVAYSLDDYRLQSANAFLAMAALVTFLVLTSQSTISVGNDPSGHQIMIGLLCLGAIFITLYYYHGHIRDYRTGLRTANQFLRQISDINPHFVFAKDTGRRFTFVNAAMTQAYGATYPMLLGKRDEEVLPNEPEQPRHHTDDERVLQTGEALFIDEEKFVTHDGQEKWVETIKKPILDDTGHVTGLLGVATDITSRRKATIELERSHSLLMAAFDSTADGLLVVNLQNEIVRYNSKFKEMWNLDQAVLEESDSAAITRASELLKDPSQFVNRIEEIYANPGVKTFDTLYLKDGRVFERYSQAQKVGQEIVGRVWSFRDVTDREMAISNLRRSEERYRYVFEHSNQAILLINAETYHPLDCNNRTLQMLNLASKAECLGMHASDIVSPSSLSAAERKEHCHALVERILSAGQERFTFENPAFGSGAFTGDVTAIRDASTDRPQIWLFIADISEITQANASLRRSENRYRTMLEDNLFPIFSLRKSRFTSVNEAVSNVTGYSQKELLGKQSEDIVHPEDLPAYHQLANDIYRGRQTSGNLATRFRRKDGSTGYLLASIKAHYDDQGTYVESIVTAADITQLKRTEQERLDTELRYRVLFEQYPVGILLVNRAGQGLGVTCNTKMLELFGCTTEEITQRTLLDLSPARQPDRSQSSALLHSMIKDVNEQHPARFEWQFLHASGEPFTASVIYQPVALKERRLAMVMIQDITQLKKAEEERNKSESNYQSLVEASPDGIIMTDVKGYITFASQRMLEMTGNDNVERVLGRHILEFSVPDERDQAERSMGKVLTSTKPVFTRLHIRIAGGALLPVEIGARTISGTTEDVYGIIMHIRDITGHIESERVLKESEERYRLLFETTFDGFLILSGEGSIVDCNFSALELMEYPDIDEMRQCTLNDLFPGIVNRKEYEAVVKGEVTKTTSIRVGGRDYNGKEIFAEVHFCVLPVSGGQRIACAIRNVAEKVILEKREREIASQKAEMDALNREITSYTLFSSQRNRLLSEIREDITEVISGSADGARRALKKVTRKIDTNLNENEDMLAFKIQFEKIHPNFFQRLLQYNSKLTNNDMKYCAYIRLNMSTQDICNLLYVEKKSVEMAKYRIKKKLRLDKKQRLSEFIHNI